MKIRNFRLTNRPLVYLDETWLNANHTVSRCWVDKTGKGGIKVPSGGGSRLIILHAGSQDGFVPNGLLCFRSKSTREYHEEMDGPTFKRWFEDQLLPNIPPESVIIMDNASYHSMKSHKIPTMSSLKRDMQQWLLDHDISFTNSMIKVQLFALIKQHSHKYPSSYVIDDIAEQHGHTVLRVPPYHCELNASELIWAQIKGGVARRNESFNLTHVKALLEDEISNVSQENWANAINHVHKLEEQIFKEELQIDNTLSEEELSSFRFLPYESDSESDSDSDADAEWPSSDSDDDLGLLWFPTEEITDDDHEEDSIMHDSDDVPEEVEFPSWTTSKAEQ